MAFLPYGLASTSFVIGDGSDGSLSTSGNVSLTSTLDGDAVVKQYTSLTVNSGHTLTVSNRCKGLHIYVQGDLVLNGTISMTARGASAENTNQIASSKSICHGIFSLQEFNILKKIHPELEDVLITASSANGGQGKSLTSSNSSTFGNNGSNGTSLFQCGGGGSGAIYSFGNSLAQSGNGGDGTFFSGGAGSGAAWSSGASSAVTSNGSSTGGAGSNGVCIFTVSYGCGGGAGNPGGNGSQAATAGGTGTGGQLIIVVGGTLSGNGVFESKGSNGGTGTSTYYLGGGGSGGGCLLVLYKNSSFTGTFNANGGSGGLSHYSNLDGGAGGNGYIHKNTIGGFFEQYG